MSPDGRYLLLAAAMFAGCGARSSLLQHESSSEEGAAGSGATDGMGGSTGGVGGSGPSGGSAGAYPTGGTGASAGTSGFGATGGSGGATATCTNISLDGVPIGFESAPSVNQWSPFFAPLDALGPRIAVAVVETTTDLTLNTPSQLRITTMEAWGDWPTGLGEGAYPEFVVGPQQVAMDHGEIDNRIAVAYPASPTPPAPQPVGVLLAPSLDPDSPSGTTGVSVTTVAAERHDLRFLTHWYGTHLVGIQRSDGDRKRFDLKYVSIEFKDGIPFLDAGCGTTPLLADAAPLPGGYIYAFSSARPLGDCQIDGNDGYAGFIHVGMFTTLGYFFEALPVELSKQDQVDFIRLVPRSDGAWMVFHYAGLNGEPYPSPPPFQLMRFDEAGTVLEGPLALEDIGNPYHPPAVARLGDQVAIGWIEPTFSDSTIRLAVVGDGAEVTAVTSLPLPGIAAGDSSLRLMGSPAGDQLIVGWTQSTEGEQDIYNEAQVARFSCF